MFPRIHQRQTLKSIEKEYPFQIQINLFRTSLLDGYYHKPYYAKTFEDAYKFAYDEAKNTFDLKDLELDKIYEKEYKVFNNENCKLKTNEPFFINSYNKSMETGIVWRSPDLGMYYICQIQKKTDDFWKLMKNYEKITIPDNNFAKIIYYSIFKVDDNVICIDSPKKANIYQVENGLFMDYGFSAIMRRSSLETVIQKFLNRNNIPKIKNEDKFICNLKKNNIFFLKNEDFEEEPDLIFSEIVIFSSNLKNRAANIIKKKLISNYNKNNFKKFLQFEKSTFFNFDIQIEILQSLLITISLSE